MKHRASAQVVKIEMPAFFKADVMLLREGNRITLEVCSSDKRWFKSKASITVNEEGRLTSTGLWKEPAKK